MKPPFFRRFRIGVAWLRGAPVVCRAPGGAVWRSAAPADTVVELAAAVREAAREWGATGGDVDLLLEHSALQHRVETVPALGKSALLRYLGHKIGRETPPVCWSAVRLLAARGEERVLLHLLPVEFVQEMRSGVGAVGFQLARIYPLSTALEAAETPGAGPTAGTADYTLAAADCGGQTVLIVQRGDGALAFARSFGAAWSHDAERLGLEVNRSVIYLRQRWNAAPQRMILYDGGGVRGAVAGRCGSGCGPVTTPPADLPGWLERLGAIRPGDGRNILAAERRAQRRRFLGRCAGAAACWAGLGIFLLSWWSEAQGIRAVREQTAALRVHRTAAGVERDRLWTRNRRVGADRNLIRHLSQAPIPPVPVRFLVYQASLLPAPLRLSSYSAAWDGRRWTVAMEGQLRGDDPATHAQLQDWQDQLQNGPWKAKFNPDRVAASPGADSRHFRLEGGLLEN